MPELKNHLEVIKILPKTNCRKCGYKTCLAFAVEVIKGRKRLEDCPDLENHVVEKYDVKTDGPSIENDMQKALEGLRRRIFVSDLASSAARLGAAFSRGRLTIKCLGKDFTIDAEGIIISECHTHLWVTLPILNYIISSAGKDVRGDWIPFRELKGGADWGPLFTQRCEKPLKKVIDGYTGLFEDIIDVFDGRPAPDSFKSDIAVVIHPLPKLPILICYWKSEGGLESTLNMFFDATAKDNLNIESIYSLGVGLVTMFERTAQTHGN